MSFAFLPPVAPMLAGRARLPTARARRPSRRAVPNRACMPPERDSDHHERHTPFQIKAPPHDHDTSECTEVDVIDDTDSTFSELDEMAEEWIGTDLGRWEWYERMKSRRERLLGVVKTREKELDSEFEELRRTFMEFDALFGTSMLDDESSISAAGWGTVAAIMCAYVGVGYWVVELVVNAFTDYSPGFPL